MFVTLTSILGLLALGARLGNCYAVTGTQGGVDSTTGARPFRQEINQFKYAGAAWDLYILSLQQLFATGQSNQFSYYQIAGIHGFPNIAWDGVTGSGGGVGYCTHGSILFPLWHRPYLALLETMLWNNAQSIAAQYPSSQKAEYQAAAVTMRIPYWDWSLNSTMPDVTTNPKITVNSPQGFVLIDNPLYNYTFHPLSPSDLPDVSQYPTTVRSPNSNTLQSQEQISNQALQNAAGYLHDNTYLLFSSQPDYQEFSNLDGGADNNIEIIHGGIHDWVGGSNPSGHMTLLWYSSMDPIFWLHHANIDRITAIWQAIYPDSYVVPQASQMTSTYYTTIGTVEDSSTPLAPFHSDNSGNLHTALSVQYLKAFGYSYPELVDWDSTSPAEFSAQVTQIVNQIYNPSSSSRKRSPSEKQFQHGFPIGAALAADTEWVLSLKINRTALARPVALYFFSANVSSTDANAWSNSPSLIGSQLLLRPQAQPNNSTTFPTLFSAPSASVPLTQALLSLPKLDAETVLPWIQTNMAWRARVVSNPAAAAGQKTGSSSNSSSYGSGSAEAPFNGSRIHDELLAGVVSLQLRARTVTPAQSDAEFPRYGDWSNFGSVGLLGDGRLSVIQVGDERLRQPRSGAHGDLA